MRLAVAFVSLLVPVLVLIVGVPVVARVMGEAAKRGQEDEEDFGKGQNTRSGGKGGSGNE